MQTPRTLNEKKFGAYENALESHRQIYSKGGVVVSYAADNAQNYVISSLGVDENQSKMNHFQQTIEYPVPISVSISIKEMYKEKIVKWIPTIISIESLQGFCKKNFDKCGIKVKTHLREINNQDLLPWYLKVGNCCKEGCDYQFQ